MAKGSSGRIVIEIHPEKKEELYKALGSKGLNLKQWFLGNIDRFLEEQANQIKPMFSDQTTQRKI